MNALKKDYIEAKGACEKNSNMITEIEQRFADIGEQIPQAQQQIVEAEQRKFAAYEDCALGKISAEDRDRVAAEYVAAKHALTVLEDTLETAETLLEKYRRKAFELSKVERRSREALWAAIAEEKGKKIVKLVGGLMDEYCAAMEVVSPGIARFGASEKLFPHPWNGGEIRDRLRKELKF